MIEQGNQGPDFFTKLEGKMESVLDMHTLAIEHITDMGALAYAYIYDAIELMKECLEN